MNKYEREIDVHTNSCMNGFKIFLTAVENIRNCENKHLLIFFSPTLPNLVVVYHRLLSDELVCGLLS